MFWGLLQSRRIAGQVPSFLLCVLHLPQLLKTGSSGTHNVKPAKPLALAAGITLGVLKRQEDPKGDSVCLPYVYSLLVVIQPHSAEPAVEIVVTS